MYEKITQDHNIALYFWYKIIIHPHEETDSSVPSGVCSHDYILKSGNEEVVCNNIGRIVQTH